MYKCIDFKNGETNLEVETFELADKAKFYPNALNRFSPPPALSLILIVCYSFRSKPMSGLES